MADNTAVYTGTGRRKEAVARVRLIPGTGKVTVNGREATQYFGRQQVVLMFSPIVMVAASTVSLVLFALALLVLCLRLASIVKTLRRLASSPVILVRLSVRSTALRRLVSVLSSPSAKAARSQNVLMEACRLSAGLFFVYF